MVIPLPNIYLSALKHSYMYVHMHKRCTKAQLKKLELHILQHIPTITDRQMARQIGRWIDKQKDILAYAYTHTYTYAHIHAHAYTRMHIQHHIHTWETSLWEDHLIAFNSLDRVCGSSWHLNLLTSHNFHGEQWKLILRTSVAIATPYLVQTTGEGDPCQ